MSKGRVSPEVQYYKDRKYEKLDYDCKVDELGDLGDLTVFIVDDEHIRNTVDIDFCMGGNYAHDDYIPDGEIWISNQLPLSDAGPTMLHEFVETHMMVDNEFSYEDAHDVANTFEKKYRNEIVGGLELDTEEEALEIAQKYADQFLSVQYSIAKAHGK